MSHGLWTYREHRHISELPDEARHGVDVIVNAPEQNRLVPDNDTSSMSFWQAISEIQEISL